MHINKDGWLFQIAYVFTGYEYDPKQVGRCVLVWRFILCVIPWFVLCIAYWVVFGLFLGLGGHMVLRTYRFWIDAAYPVFKDRMHYRSWLWIPGRNALIRANVLNWREKKRPIHWLRFLSDERGYELMPPLMAVIMCLICLSILYVLVYKLPFIWIPAVWHSTGLPLAQFMYATMSWWGWLFMAMACAVMLWFAWTWFSKTEIGSVVVTHFKEWKQRHCPIYDVV